jgi:gluconolactonase
MRKSLLILFVFSGLFSACKSTGIDNVEDATSEASIEWLTADKSTLIDTDSKIEILASGFNWSEGPVWIKEENRLLFSDVPNNVIYSWTEKDSITIFMKPSGYFDTVPTKREMGANGLIRDKEGNLIMCQHGERCVAKLRYPFADNKVTTPIVSTYQNKRFNSPNDVCLDPNDNMYFTDPPYGLEKLEDDSTKEIPFQGVYRVKHGIAYLLIDSLTRPNGIAYIPEAKELWVANSDPHKAYITSYKIDSLGNILSGKLMYDATSLVGSKKGLPDGMVYHSSGRVFCTGPGGVLIFDTNGVLVGRINLPVAAANVTLDDKEEYLYITAHMHLMRVKLIK